MFSTIQKYLSPLLQEKFLMARGLVIYVGWVLYDLMSIYFLATIIENLEKGTLDSFTSELMLYLGVIIFFNILLYIGRNRTWTDVGPAYAKVLHREYMKQFIEIDSTYLDKIGTGRTINIIQRGIDQRSRSLEDFLNTGTRLTLTLVYLVVTFRSVGIEYMLGFIAIMILCVLFAWYCNQKVLKARAKRIDANNGYTKQLVKMIMSKNEILQSEKIHKEIENLDYYKDQYSLHSRNTNPWIHRFFFVPRIFFDIGRVILFGYAGRVVFTSGGSISEIVILGGGLVFLDQLLDKALVFYKDITRDFDYVKKMREFFEEGKTDYDINVGEQFVYQGGEILLKNVTFSYGKASVLSEFTLAAQGEKKTALVGPSGAGKSTIVKLLAGYIRADSGAVIVDGQDLSEVSLKSYYNHIGYLTQEPSVFDGTIRENLLYALESKSPLAPLGERRESKKNNSPSLAKKGLGDEYDLETRIENAIKQANCEFIYDLPNGLDTEIGERGIRLSGGQRQRLAIAKIFLKNPEIIILDEPTSALDSFSEELITKAMNELFKNRTVIIIAHRLQTVKHADDIILLEGGHVVERGTHDELVKQGGQYAKMLELQSGF